MTTTNNHLPKDAFKRVLSVDYFMNKHLFDFYRRGLRLGALSHDQAERARLKEHRAKEHTLRVTRHAMPAQLNMAGNESARHAWIEARKAHSLLRKHNTRGNTHTKKAPRPASLSFAAS